ncbi:MAG: arylsulfatase [Hyphomicrobiaceae bacterium]
MSKFAIATALAMVLATAPVISEAQSSKPNIVIIWGDDIGRTNISHWSRGMMGYSTPNIDRVAQEGMTFTDYYGEQSCTAGRSAFITGQAVFRTGLSKVGMPGAPQGMQKEDPTMATLLKEQGYATGQFGKNHLGDRNEHLPTVHGFEEFFGNLYHLNAEEEPETRDYPRDRLLPDGRTFLEAFGPRGVLDCKATDTDNDQGDPRFGPMGRQQCTDTGPLTRKRMQTIDDDIAERAKEFMSRQVVAKKPFFVWVNFTHMHFRTHVKPQQVGQAGPSQSNYHDGMLNHDRNVGQVLDHIDALGISDDTIVMYSTDNGPHKNTWPDAATSPFRNEKNSGWEGAFRVPAFVRWPGTIKPGSVSNTIVSHLDWIPTFMAAVGINNIQSKLINGYTAAGRQYKVHLDGYNLLPHLKGEQENGPRDRFFYHSDDGDLLALRFENWKTHFMVQDQRGTLEIWQREFRNLRLPLVFNLRTDPFEQATITSNTYWDWMIDRAWILYPMGPVVSAYLKTYEKFPPRQKVGSFTISNALDLITNSTRK